MIMDIEIIYSKLDEAVSEEISRVAARTYSDDGASLYDGLVQLSRDKNVMKIFKREALAVVQAAIVRFIAQVTEKEDVIIFSFFGSERRLRGKKNIIETLIKSALAKAIISKYFLEKQQEGLASTFDEMAASDIQSLIKNLYEKASPIV